MLLPNGMEIAILDSEGQPHQELGTEYVATHEWRAYICAESNKPFAIQIIRSEPSDENLTADIWMNGGRPKIHTIKFPKGQARADVVRGVERRRMMHPFVFNQLETTDEIMEACEDNDILGSIGEIMISTCPYDVEERKSEHGGDHRRDFEPRIPNADIKVHEQSKKALMQNVSVGFGQPREMGRERKQMPQPYVYVRKDPIYKVRFLPRSEFSLERAGIIDAQTAAALSEERRRRARSCGSDDRMQYTTGYNRQARAPYEGSRMPNWTGASSFFPNSARSGPRGQGQGPRPEDPGRAPDRDGSPDFILVEVKREEDRQEKVGSGAGHSAAEPLEISDDSDVELQLSSDSDDDFEDAYAAVPQSPTSFR